MLRHIANPARVSCAALLLALGLRCAPAAAGGFSAPEAGARLSPGSLCTASWSPTPGTAVARETELLLSLDGGLTFPIRLTRDLHPETYSVLFRVPHLPTTNARLGHRIGLGRPGEAELIETIGPEFVIEPDFHASLEPLVSVRGEWRTHEALEEPISAWPGEASLAGHPTRVSAFTQEDELDEPQSAVEVSSRPSAGPELVEEIADLAPLPSPLCRGQVSRPKLE
jgi:hypothetical protein